MKKTNVKNDKVSIYEGLQKITGLWVESEYMKGKNIMIVKGELKNDKQRYDIFATDLQKDISVRVGMLWAGKTKSDKNYYFGYMFDCRAVVMRNTKKSEKAPDWNLYITKKEYIKE